MPRVHVLIGSKSDEKYLKESELIRTLRRASFRNGITVRGNAISAHYNIDKLIEYVQGQTNPGDIYICGADWAATLPGTVKAVLLGMRGFEAVPVLGVALPSDKYPRAAIAIRQLPPDVDIYYAGVGSEGLDHAAKHALKLIRNFTEGRYAQECAGLAEKIAAMKPEELDFNSYPNTAA